MLLHSPLQSTNTTSEKILEERLRYMHCLFCSFDWSGFIANAIFFSKNQIIVHCGKLYAKNTRNRKLTTKMTLIFLTIGVLKIHISSQLIVPNRC